MARHWQKKKYNRISHTAAEKMTGINACKVLVISFYYIHSQERLHPMPDDRAFQICGHPYHSPRQPRREAKFGIKCFVKVTAFFSFIAFSSSTNIQKGGGPQA